MKQMYNPPHPGEFIKEVYLDELDLTIKEVANKLNISSSTLSRLVNKKISVSAKMAMRLSITLGRTPQSWLSMQNNYDLLEAQKDFDINNIKVLKIPA